MSLRVEIARLRAEVDRLKLASTDDPYAQDPAALMEAAGLQPDPWQRDLLGSDWKRALLLCCRQSGKSITTAALASHLACSVPKSEVLAIAPSWRQSMELLRRIMELYRASGMNVHAEAESMTRVVLSNGSRIISLPDKPNTIRGYTPHLVLIDEAAWVSDDSYFAIRPMLAVSGGRLVALSTPWGKRGWFYHEWTEGENWKRVRVTAYDCPRITAAFLEEERRTMPDPWFRSEYLCEFTDTEENFFRYEDIEAAFDNDLQPFFSGDGASETGLLLS